MKQLVNRLTDTLIKNDIAFTIKSKTEGNKDTIKAFMFDDRIIFEHNNHKTKRIKITKIFNNFQLNNYLKETLNL